ncbi:MAG: DUF192 domain-containing protein [Rhodospirillales bacterium]|jgi:uncharacterized membrane protein (UPF0127 family)
MNDLSRKISRRVFLSLLGLAAFSISAFSQGLVKFKKSKVLINSVKGKHQFEVEMAITDQQHAQGLMYRRSMAANAGMLFDYGTPQRIRMWMRNTFIPLDMLFIDGNGKIINIAERTVPRSETVIGSKEYVRAVLELNGGTVSRLAIKPGDLVYHPIFEVR